MSQSVLELPNNIISVEMTFNFPIRYEYYDKPREENDLKNGFKVCNA